MSRQMAWNHQDPPGRRGRRWMALARAATAAVVAASALVASVAAAAAEDDSRPPAAALSQSEAACSELVSLDLDSTVAFKAELVTSGQAAGQANLPEFCRVALTVSQAINIEVWLPTSTYNRRFQAVGGGGYDGAIGYAAMASALREGYATSSTDSGHVGDSAMGTFAWNADGTLNDQLIEDFASRAVIEMTLKAKELIGVFYGGEAKYSYFTGCSNGGRQGMMLAQRLPEEYDGVLAGSPAQSWHQMLMSALWPFVATQNELGAPMSACKLTAFNEAAIKHCDPYDGVVDGVIGDPTRCDFDPATLVGKDFGCGPITAADAKVVKMTYEGPKGTDGEQLWTGMWPGLPLELYAGEPHVMVQSHLRWAVGDPDFDWHTLDYAEFAQVFRQGQARFGDVLGADDPDLRPFKNSGGKLVMWAGGAEVAIPGQVSGYYERVIDEFRSAHQVGTFARLFLAPGVDHCRGGVGPNVFDAFSALREWVERDEAPDSILASKIVGGQVVRTQPLCPYPTVAKYDGRGSVMDASSYQCRPNYGGASAPNNGK